MRYRLSTLFLVTAIVGISLGWYLDRSKKPELLYLHLYSNRFVNYTIGARPPLPREWQCLFSIAVTPGVPFDVNMPNHFEPTMKLSGKIEFDGMNVSPDIVIDLSAGNLGITHILTETLEIGSVDEFGSGYFRLSFSKSELPK